VNACPGYRSSRSPCTASARAVIRPRLRRPWRRTACPGHQPPRRSCLLSAWSLAGVAAVLLAAAAPAVAAEDGAIAVSTRAFAEVAVAVEASAPAEVVGRRRSVVAARVDSTVERLAVEVGDRVEVDATIAVLDCGDLEARLEQARGRVEELEARLRMARLRFERVTRLRAEDAVAQDTLDEAEAEVDALAGTLRSGRGTRLEARRAVGHCSVRAPFGGVITERRVSEGDWVTTGQPVVELLDIERRELRADVPDRHEFVARRFADAAFEFDGERYPVELRSILPASDAAARTRELRFELPADAPAIGTAGRLAWTTAPRAVPADLVQRRGGRSGVMVVRDGRARFHRLADAVEGRPVPAPDLAPAARLIIEGRREVRGGTAVRVLTGDAGDDT